MVEALGDVPQVAANTYALPDLAWESEAWMLVRLHIAPGLSADPRQLHALLAVALEADGGGGECVEQGHAVLSVPLVPESDIKGLPQHATVKQRREELEFAAAAGRIHALLTHGEVRKAKELLAGLEGRVADHPWLLDKLTALKALMERDIGMSAKEARYSMHRMSARLAAVDETRYLASETESTDMPTWLRRKASEGEGRKRCK